MKATPACVGNWMTEAVVTLGPEDNLGLASDIIALGRLRHLPVVDHGRLIGLVTHRDVLRALASPTRQLLAREAMTPRPRCVRPTTPISRAIRLMLTNRFGCLPVVDAHRHLVGIVTETDLLRYAAAAGKEVDSSRSPSPHTRLPPGIATRL